MQFSEDFSQFSETPFYLACSRGYHEVVRYFLRFQGKPIDLNIPSALGWTPLYAAAFTADEELLALLLADPRVDVNIPNLQGETPLWKAAENGQLGVVRLMLAYRRIDAGRAGSSDRSAAEIARAKGAVAEKGFLETEEFFREKKERCLMIAALLEAFEKDSQGVQLQVRKEVGDVVWMSGFFDIPLTLPSQIFPEGCWDPKEIQTLVLKGKELRLMALPPRIAECTNLTKLDLTGNPLDDSSADLIADLLKTGSLIVVRLQFTGIGPKGMLKIMQAMVWNFSRSKFMLRRFEVDDMKLRSFEGLGIIPVDILEEGSQKIAQYLLDLFRSPEGDPLFRSKLMVVGFAEIGKTSMLECLFPMAGTLFSREVKKKMLHSKVKYLPCLLRLTGNNLIQSQAISQEDGKVAPEKYFGTLLLSGEKGWTVARIDDHEKPGFRIQCQADEFVRDLYCDDKGERENWYHRIDGLLRRDRTHGIDIREVDVTNNPAVQKHFARSNSTGKLVLSVWDFAGQHDYYNNHKHFLSTRSVFLVLWNVSEFDERAWNDAADRKGQDPAGRPRRAWQRGKPSPQGKGIEGLRFWLSSLSLHLDQQNEGEFFKVVVVGTHFDRLSERDQNKMGFRKDLVRKLAESYGLEMANYLEVSCVNELENIPELLDLVLEETLRMKYMGERLPASYLSLETHLKSLLKQTRDYPVLDVRVINDLFQDERLVRDALSLLSKWGKCVYFEKEARLRDKVILDPQFLSKTTLAGLFRLGDEAMAKRENGVINHRDLKTFWCDLADRPDFWEIAELLISLMEKIDVCFLVPGDQERPFQDQRSLVPSLLPFKPLVNRLRTPSEMDVEDPSKTQPLYGSSPQGRQLPSALRFGWLNSAVSAQSDSDLLSRRKFEEDKYKRFEVLWPSRLPLSQPIEMERIFSFSVVPEELVSLVLSRAHSLIQEGCVWRDFALLHLVDAEPAGPEHVGTQAILQVSIDENYFLVEIRSGQYEKGVRLLERIRDIFEEASGKHSFPQWRECVRSPYFASSLIEVSEIMKFGDEEEGKKINCPVTGTPIMVSLLKRRAGLTPPQSALAARARFGTLVVKGGKKVPGVDRRAFEELGKYLAFFGGRVEDVTEAYRLNDELGLGDAFRVNRKQLFLQHEAGPELFKKTSHLEVIEGRELRIDYLRWFNGKMSEFPELEVPGLTDVIPVLNGHSENAAWNIGITGFNYSPTLDSGYFGSGIYFTTSARYALGYGDHLVISLANAGNVYPVIEHPFEEEGKVVGKDGRPVPNKEGFFGKPLVGGYQSHYSIVKGGYPVKNVREDAMDELVLFQAAQALPLFIVKYGAYTGKAPTPTVVPESISAPLPPPLPQIPATTTEEPPIQPLQPPLLAPNIPASLVQTEKVEPQTPPASEVDILREQNRSLQNQVKESSERCSRINEELQKLVKENDDLRRLVHALQTALERK